MMMMMIYDERFCSWECALLVNILSYLFNVSYRIYLPFALLGNGTKIRTMSLMSLGDVAAHLKGELLFLWLRSFLLGRP